MIGLLVPAGDFLTGAEDSDSEAADNERPRHTVYLDAVWIDRTDVTTAMYAKCVGAGACTPPSSSSSYSHTSYYGNSQFAAYPVI